MVMKINCVDIGARIRQEVEAQHWSYTKFAQAINCSRSSLYNIFNSSDINLQRILQISKVLNVDFIREFYDLECDTEQRNYGAAPYIYIPMTGENFDFSKIPYPLLKLLKSGIDSDPRMSPDVNSDV